MSTATCDIRFSLQNRYAADSLAGELAGLGISNRAVTISGRATRSEKEITQEEFVGAHAETIRTTLTRFLDTHVLPRANDLVILDMEPNKIAPRNLGDFQGKEQRELIAAYRRRIRVARQVLRRRGLPGLRLGLYQVIVPDGKGRSSEAFERRMGGYMEAGRQGMYDQLDFICPVLYQRFGPDDAKPETVRKWVAAASRQAIEGSLALTRRNGRRIPLVPILSFWVFNGGSATTEAPFPPRAWLVSCRLCRTPSASTPSCFGRDGRPRRRWSRPRSQSSRSTSTTSCSASARCPGRGAHERMIRQSLPPD